MLPFPESVFISGISTGVGKTIVSSILVEALGASYWKPVQCGNLDNSDSIVVQSLISNPDSRIYREAYRLKTASSPHYAAQMEGVEIDTSKCVKPFTTHMLVIEGAGGLMVPLNRKEFVADLAYILNTPVVLVCRNYLGSINHTLLSIELLRERGIQLAGLIFSGDNFLDNEEIIQHFGQTDILGRIDEATVIDKQFVQQQALKLKASLSKKYSF